MLHEHVGIGVYLCIGMGVYLCIGMGVYLCIGMGVYLCIGMGVYLCIGMGVYLCIGMGVYLCIGMGVYLCIGMGVYLCIGMGVYLCVGMGVYLCVGMGVLYWSLQPDAQAKSGTYRTYGQPLNQLDSRYLLPLLLARAALTATASFISSPIFIIFTFSFISMSEMVDFSTPYLLEGIVAESVYLFSSYGITTLPSILKTFLFLLLAFSFELQVVLLFS